MSAPNLSPDLPAAPGGTRPMTLISGTRPPHLLVVDDEGAILDLLRRRLETLGCTVTTLPGGSQAVQTARECRPDLILLDLMMPDLDGFSVCRALKADPEVADVPVIMMTARAEVDSRIQGLELGAHDYVAKPFETAELIARIRAALRVKALQDELKAANRRLEHLAANDPLTDLPNRRTFDEQFFVAVERARRNAQVLSVLMIDLDHFKRVNDAHGHQFGDEALRLVGRVLSARRRVTDLAARYGGEEFVWVLPGAAAGDAVEMAEWLRRTVGALALDGPGGRVGLAVSVGVSTYEPGQHGPIPAGAVLESADRALREAKMAGRNRVVFRPLDVDEVVSPEKAGEEGTPEGTRYR